jgi:hypothetical protein
MPSAKFEPAIPAIEQLQTYALDSGHRDRQHTHLFNYKSPPALQFYINIRSVKTKEKAYGEEYLDVRGSKYREIKKKVSNDELHICTL